ncbi:MAG: peroxiredoxin, partial [Mesorhizobium sp.]
MTISVGEKLPASNFKVMTADGAKPITGDEIFADPSSIVGSI